MLQSLGLSQTQSYEDIKGPPSSPPGYPVTTSQCSAITKWYCIRPMDILGSSQAKSNKAFVQASGPHCQNQGCGAAGQVVEMPSLFSAPLPTHPLHILLTNQIHLVASSPLSLPWSQMPPPLFSLIALCKVFGSTFWCISCFSACPGHSLRS